VAARILPRYYSEPSGNRLYPQSISQFLHLSQYLGSSFPLPSTFFSTTLLFFHIPQKWHVADDSFHAKPIGDAVALQQLEACGEKISLPDGFANFNFFHPEV
jgi:hypothetical protein